MMSAVAGQALWRLGRRHRDDRVGLYGFLTQQVPEERARGRQARHVRVVQFEGYRLEFRPKGYLLLVRNEDVPGVVGKVGTLLGDAGANIAEIHLARSQEDHPAIAVVRLDGRLDAATVEEMILLE